MDKFRWMVAGIGALIVIAVGASLFLIVMPGASPKQEATPYSGIIPAGRLLRVPVTGIYPGGTAAGLAPAIANPLANDPDAAERGMKDFDAFNCSGCHMANGGGGMGPALSNDVWLYRSSPANIYLSIVQGRGAGMPAFGAMLPDRTVWELVAYIQNISKKPAPTFGRTTSAVPPMPNTEQVPAGETYTTTPWNDMEPMPADGGRPGGGNPNG